MIFDLFLKVFLIGCTVFFIPGQEFYGPQEVFFQYGAMALLAISYATKREREVTNKFLGMFFLYALANTILFHFNPVSRIKVLNLFLGMFLIKETSERMTLNFEMVGNLLALFCALNVAWIGLQLNQIDPIFSSMNPQNMPQVDTVGFMGLKANLGCLAALAFPFIFEASPLASIICLPLLWFGQSSTAVLAFMISFLFLMWFKNRKLFWILAGICLAGGIYYIFCKDLPTGEFPKRIKVWMAGISYLAGTKPWFGHGLGAWAVTGFTTLQQNGEPQQWVWAHNEFIQLAFEIGVVGMVCLYAYFKDLFKVINLKYGNHRLAISILIPLVIISFFHFPAHLGRFAGLVCFMIAAVEALISEDKV